MTQLPSLERWALLPFRGFSYPNLLFVFLNLLFLGTCIICSRKCWTFSGSFLFCFGGSKGLTNRSSIESKLPYMYCNQRMYNRRSRNSWQRRRHCRQSLSQNCKKSGESSSRKNTLSYIPMEPPFTIRHTYLAQLSFLYLPLHSTNQRRDILHC